MKQSDVVNVKEKCSVVITSNFETATENPNCLHNLNVSNKELEVAKRLTQFELNTQSNEPLSPQTDLVDNKRSLVQLAFKSTNSDFETATEGPDPSKTEMEEKRSLVQIPLKESTETTHDMQNFETANVATLTENVALRAINENLDKNELGNDVAQRLTQFELNSQEPVDKFGIVTSQHSIVDTVEIVNNMTQESSHSQAIHLSDLKAKSPLQVTEGSQATIEEALSDSQSLNSPVKSTEEAAVKIKVNQKVMSQKSTQSSQLQNFTIRHLRVNLIREPLVKRLIEESPNDSEELAVTKNKMNTAVAASPVRKLSQSNSFIPSAYSVDLHQANKESDTQFETVAKRLTQFELYSSPQMEEANMVELPNQKPEGLKDLSTNVVKEPTESEVEVETIKNTSIPDLDRTTQELFVPLSPDTQARQIMPEVASEEVFLTQDILNNLSLKVNVGVTNESTVDQNENDLLHTEVESAVEEIFIDLTKDDTMVEMEVMENRHLSTQELLTVLDKTVSQKSHDGKCLFHLKMFVFFFLKNRFYPLILGF